MVGNHELTVFLECHHILIVIVNCVFSVDESVIEMIVALYLSRPVYICIYIPYDRVCVYCILIYPEPIRGRRGTDRVFCITEYSSHDGWYFCIAFLW